jgi:hypothetical protein
MARFEGTVKESWSVGCTPDAARAHFLDLGAIAAATVGVERTEVVGDGRLRFVLAAQQHGPYRFQPDYVVWYRREGDDVVWTPVSGNLSNTGRARFVAVGSGARVEVEQSIGLELPIPALAVGLVRPVVDRMMAPGVRDWQQRMARSAPGA